MKYLLLLFIFCSCQKQTEYIGNTYTSYSLVRDWYTTDTVWVNRAVLWKEDKIYLPADKARIEAQKPQWKVMCETETLPLRLEHWYYTKNGVKIHKSNWPK